MFCFTFVSDHNTDCTMLYSVQLKNMYSYPNSSLKLSDIVRGLSYQQSYCNLLSLYKNSSLSFLLFYLTIVYFYHPHHVQAFRFMVGPGHCPMISKYDPSLSKAVSPVDPSFLVKNIHLTASL